MSNGTDGKAKERATKLGICLPEQASVPGTDQSPSKESRDIREAKARHPSKRAEPVGSKQYLRVIAACPG